METLVQEKKLVGTDDRPPLIDNENADKVRFTIPEPPNYSAFQSLLSVLSLILLAGVGAYLYLQLKAQPLWITLPFLLTVFGGGVGALLELGLLVTGSPFQMMKSRFTTGIQMIRFLNIAPVVTSIFFFVTTMVLTNTGLHMGILFLAAFATFAMGTILYFGPPNAAIPPIILGTQLAQLIIILASGILHTPLYMVGVFLLIQAVTQAAAFVVGTSTPLKSTGFHVLSTISGVLLYLAVIEALKIDPAWLAAKAFSLTPLLKLCLVLTCLAGIFFALRAAPKTYYVIRSRVSNAIWSLQYFLLISAKRFPNPKNLSELYKDGAPEPSKLKPYYQQHPQFLPEALNIPSVERIEGNVSAFGTLVKKVKKTFMVIALMDHFFPQADLTVPLSKKPRMKVWSDGKDIYPRIYTRKLFGLSLPIPKFKITPPPVIDAYKEGQLLAYLAEYGIANPFLKKAPDREGYLMMDFRFLEKYVEKPDYEPYGGVAYFKVNSEKKRLELTSIIEPRTNIELKPNVMDASFRRAESMITASMYFQVISGKHLADIHMTYNLLEVVFHNAFDAQGQFNHPFRTFMYLHLFSHELAEELTTEHLVQEGAVFSQIFALRHDSLIDHLNDQYHSFEYAEDEDFDYRADIMRMDNGEILPGACINWELQYREIWTNYTDQLIDIIYKDDDAVRNDRYLQDMLRGLKQVYFNPLPERYDDLKTKKGVSRWASDTIHHLVVRHQVYGTSGINSALDPRISSPQVPKDSGTPGVDEWRSLTGVALATACARFTLLYGKDGEKFVYLLDGVDEQYKDKMAHVFEELHDNLEKLDKEWTKDSSSREYNYNYFRAIPSDLRTGPGY